MDLVFAHHELLDVIEMDPLTINPTAAFLKKDHQVKYFYQESVLDEVFEEICNCEYATKMHAAFDDKYNVQSVARQVQLQMELQKVYQKYEETFADYYRRARGIQRSLKDAGYKTEEATFCTIVYQGIRPNDFETHF
jgi:rRNA maturation endonuclease Nob1